MYLNTTIIRYFIVRFIFPFTCLKLEIAHSNTFDLQGPTFTIEPPVRIEFISTVGARADCMTRGIPVPTIEWYDEDNSPVTQIPKVLYIRI